MPDDRIDLAIVGAGIAGLYIADRAQRARPDWAISVFERTNRIGGRLRSISAPGVAHRIELGGMRFMSSHSRIESIVQDFGLATHPFNAGGGGERQHLRGVVSDGPADPAGGAKYALEEGERGRSAMDLWTVAFDRIVPGWAGLDHDSFARLRATTMFRDRRLTDWGIGDALETVLSAEASRYVADAFGYDSGITAFNAGDFLEFLGSGGDPTAEARTPDDGMDVLPRSLAERFGARGGSMSLRRELTSLAVHDGLPVLEFASGTPIAADRVVVTTPVPALELLAARSPVLRQRQFRRVVASVEGFPAMKLYAWYARPWWRPGIAALRSVTDLPVRKVFYLDGAGTAPAVLLAMYTDGRHVEPWISAAGGISDGAAAPAAMLAAIQRQLTAMHPEVADVPRPLGSALMHWGHDPHDVGWHFWRPGAVSDDILEIAPQPDPTLPIYLAGEAFSRLQSWAEGALESADAVLDRLVPTTTAIPELPV